MVVICTVTAKMLFGDGTKMGKEDGWNGFEKKNRDNGK